MVKRTLYGVLILLIFSAPLTAAVCSGCAPGQCMMFEESAAPRPPEANDPHAASLAAESHCHPEEAAAAGNDTGSFLTSPDCCVTQAVTTTESFAVTTGFTTFDFLLQAISSLDAGEVATQGTEVSRHRPPPLPSHPLYTLHRAFLI